MKSLYLILLLSFATISNTFTLKLPADDNDKDLFIFVTYFSNSKLTVSQFLEYLDLPDFDSLELTVIFDGNPNKNGYFTFNDPKSSMNSLCLLFSGPDISDPNLRIEILYIKFKGVAKLPNLAKRLVARLSGLLRAVDYSNTYSSIHIGSYSSRQNGHVYIGAYVWATVPGISYSMEQDRVNINRQFVETLIRDGGWEIGEVRILSDMMKRWSGPSDLADFKGDGVPGREGIRWGKLFLSCGLHSKLVKCEVRWFGIIYPNRISLSPSLTE